MRFSCLLTALAVFSLPALSLSAAAAVTLPDGCGNDAVQYKVKTQKDQPLPAPEAGLSQLVVIHSLHGDWAGAPIARIAIDGKWLGAAKGRSFFAVNIAPGPHKVCVSRQGSSRAEKENVQVAVIQAKAGEPLFLLFTIDRREIDATDGHAGGQMQGYATPDMTAKRHETEDDALFAQLSSADAAAYMWNLPESFPEQK